MSLSWRDLVKKSKERLMQKESLTEEEWQWLMEHMGDLCAESDTQIKMVFGEYCNVDREVEKMEDQQFIEMTIEVFNKIFKKFKKKRKKQQQTEETQESEPEESVDDQEEGIKEEEEIAIFSKYHF